MIEQRSKAKVMPFAVRPMEERDITQATEIERDAFPSMVPHTSFRRELKNRLAAYLVARSLDEAHEEQPHPVAPHGGAESDGRRGLVGLALQNARNLWTGRATAREPGEEYLVGTLGIWYMADEAHIVSVAVRTEYRGCGLGELLLIAGVEQALERGCDAVTLEVRTSNHVAQNLYKKYGLLERGLRKGYYSDNREDALIMTTEPIQTGAYLAWFRHLVEEHEATWGRGERILA